MYGKGKSPYNEPNVRDHPYITSANGLGRWVWKKAIFDDVQYCVYADLSGWVGQKSSKLSRWNIWAVPYLTLFTPPIPSKIIRENARAKSFCGILPEFKKKYVENMKKIMRAV